MSYEELRDRIVRGRKEYRCSWCGETIAKGEQHHSRSYTVCGEFNSSREHIECSKAMETISSSEWMDMDNTYFPGDYKRGSKERR